MRWQSDFQNKGTTPHRENWLWNYLIETDHPSIEYEFGKWCISLNDDKTIFYSVIKFSPKDTLQYKEGIDVLFPGASEEKQDTGDNY